MSWMPETPSLYLSPGGGEIGAPKGGFQTRPYDGLLEDSPQRARRARREEWIPAFAGMTMWGGIGDGLMGSIFVKMAGGLCVLCAITKSEQLRVQDRREPALVVSEPWGRQWRHTAA